MNSDSSAVSDVPFLAAATGRPARHTPVWFMRQAGRSLPEYRALRGDGSILDAIKQVDLSVELTLQPVRRYGVDAGTMTRQSDGTYLIDPDGAGSASSLMT